MIVKEEVFRAKWIVVVKLFERHKCGVRMLILFSSCCVKVNAEAVGFFISLEEDIGDA